MERRSVGGFVCAPIIIPNDGSLNGNEINDVKASISSTMMPLAAQAHTHTVLHAQSFHNVQFVGL